MANEQPPARAAYHSNDAPPVGSVLAARFRVLRQLGEGGMGVVLEAENTLTGKRVAIKWMRAALATKPEAVERFLREARASARVRHPNVVDVYDVVQAADSAFLVMELLEGEPLTAVLERGGMPAHELITLLLDAMRGVAAAHKQGVIHRDIKPDNIFLEIDDRGRRTPKVLDFGISKLSGGEGLSLTQTGATLGTPLYMSFEQLCGAKDIDARTDVYAFGVILYEALTGRPPFAAETFTELIIKITNTRPTPPKALRGDIPRSLDALIQKAMAKERDERVLSLDVMISELERFASAELFRAQMTADHGPMPRVVSPSERPLTEPPLLLSERADTAADTPMSASVPPPGIPRRKDGKLWMIGGAALIGSLAAWMFLGSKNEADPVNHAPKAALQAAAPSPTAATVQPSAATPGRQVDSLPSDQAEIPAGKEPPPSAAQEAEPVAKKAEPKAKPAPARVEPHVIPRPDPRPARPVLSARPPLPGELPVPAPASKAPAANSGNPTKLRAGNLNSQEF